MIAIDLALAGPSEGAWGAVCAVLPRFVPPSHRRLVVVSPHPDDETFGAGGLICSAVDNSIPVVVISVTNGEAAFPNDRQLAKKRRLERYAALQCLDPGRSTIQTMELSFPDGCIEAWADELSEVLHGLLESTDLVVCPLSDDGHPDHHGAARAALDASQRRGTASHMFPIWAWHCHQPATSVIAAGQRFHLSRSAQCRKRAAIRQYQSQISGPSPVVPPAMLNRLSRSFEVFVPS